MSMLDTEDETHEAAVLAGVLAHRDSDDRTAVAVLSEDTSPGAGPRSGRDGHQQLRRRGAGGYR